MKEINKCGHVIDSIAILNSMRTNCLPKGCGDCRFFEIFGEDDPRSDNKMWRGECTLARGRLFRGGCMMDEVDCPLDHLEGVDERIWGVEPTNSWGRNYKAVDMCASGRKHRLERIEQLETLLKEEKKELIGLMDFHKDNE